MKPPFKQRHTLLRPLAGMTISILSLFLLSYFFIINSSARLNLNASVTKIAAQQRSLSQQIVNSIAADNLEGELVEVPLDSLTHVLSQLQSVLLNGNSHLNIKPLKESLMEEYTRVDNTFNKFAAQVDTNIANDKNENFVDLLKAENLYIQQLDNFTNKITGYSNEEVKYFRLKEICILFISILLILLQIRLIFLPAITRIERQNNALREISFTQSHIVRRPLANIQSLLAMTLDAKNQDPYSTQLLTLAKKEADELDAVIKGNINKSDKNYKYVK